jgi:hypothetical protein
MAAGRVVEEEKRLPRPIQPLILQRGGNSPRHSLQQGSAMNAEVVPFFY